MSAPAMRHPRLARVLCAISALICAGVGLASLANVEGVAATVGLAFASPAGKVELLAVYGGFYLGVGLFLAVATLRGAFLEPALVLVALAATATAVARGLAMLVLAPEAAIAWQLLASEVVWALTGWVGWWSARRGR